MDGDLVVNLPLSDIYDQHIKSGADITVVCGNDSFETENGTYFELDGTGRVTDVLYHLHRPRGYRGLEVYILSTRLLLDLVDECATRDQYSLRRDVLQARKDSLKLQGYIWGGFAAQIRSVQEYYDRSMQLLDPAIRAELFCAERPIRAKATDKSSAYIGPDGYCENSLIADGCNIEGVVENSILFPGVVVEAGAVVRNCVLFKETAVRRGAAILGEVAGYGFSSNGEHISVPNVDGPRRSLLRCLEDAGMRPEEIPYVNAHATSTPLGDYNEAEAIAGVFAGCNPYVASTKSMTGHEMWMAGASEVVYSMLMMRHGFIAPNINFTEGDEATSKLNIPVRRVDTEFDCFLSNSFGFGGTNSTLIVKKYK